MESECISLARRVVNLVNLDHSRPADTLLQQKKLD